MFGYDDDDVRHRRHATPCWISDRVDNQMEWYYVTVEGWAVLTYVFGGVLYAIITISVQCQVIVLQPSGNGFMIGLFNAVIFMDW